MNTKTGEYITELEALQVVARDVLKENRRVRLVGEAEGFEDGEEFESDGFDELKPDDAQRLRKVVDELGLENFPSQIETICNRNGLRVRTGETNGPYAEWDEDSDGSDCLWLEGDVVATIESDKPFTFTKQKAIQVFTYDDMIYDPSFSNVPETVDINKVTFFYSINTTRNTYTITIRLTDDSEYLLRKDITLKREPNATEVNFLQGLNNLTKQIAEILYTNERQPGMNEKINPQETLAYFQYFKKTFSEYAEFISMVGEEYGIKAKPWGTTEIVNGNLIRENFTIDPIKMVYEGRPVSIYFISLFIKPEKDKIGFGYSLGMRLLGEDGQRTGDAYGWGLCANGITGQDVSFFDNPKCITGPAVQVAENGMREFEDLNRDAIEFVVSILGDLRKR